MEKKEEKQPLEERIRIFETTQLKKRTKYVAEFTKKELGKYWKITVPYHGQIRYM